MKKRIKSGIYATREQLEQDYLVDKLPMNTIAEKYGYADFSKVWRAIKRYGIPLRGRCNLPAQYIRPTQLLGEKLSSVQLQLVYGSLLGDGTLCSTKERKNSYFATTHTIKHSEYIDWHVKVLGDWVSKVYYRHSRPSQLVPYSSDALMLQSISHLEFTNLRQWFYPNGIKIIPSGLLDELTPLAVAVWIMDDGCFSGNFIDIATEGFSKEENSIIADWFEIRWKLQAKTCKHSGGSGVGVRVGPIAKIIKLFGEYFVPCMKYKLGC